MTCAIRPVLATEVCLLGYICELPRPMQQTLARHGQWSIEFEYCRGQMFQLWTHMRISPNNFWLHCTKKAADTEVTSQSAGLHVGPARAIIISVWTSAVTVMITTSVYWSVGVLPPLSMTIARRGEPVHGYRCRHASQHCEPNSNSPSQRTAQLS